VSERSDYHDILPMAFAYIDKPGNAIGGSFYHLMNGGHVSDGQVRHMRERALQAGDEDGVAFGDALLLLSKTQRSKVAEAMWRHFEEAGAA
jgi:hypothetical protein